MPRQQRLCSIKRATLLCEPSFDVVLAMLLEPLSARCGISPNENRTDRKAGSTSYRVKTLRMRVSVMSSGRGDFVECKDL